MEADLPERRRQHFVGSLLYHTQGQVTVFLSGFHFGFHDPHGVIKESFLGVGKTGTRGPVGHSSWTHGGIDAGEQQQHEKTLRDAHDWGYGLVVTGKEMLSLTRNIR
ncbi:hypothetical protein E2C01_018080 [Portunus trituberculatus]|uniref:Uncharacterized protein n=1 Tax=Portunus trituberculatus TaxID=210409 RepID=A0A5B7DVI1_PORTR|nr:hypothetical protein [Portunus trituberculatus]